MSPSSRCTGRWGWQIRGGRWFGFTDIFNILIVPASIVCGFMWQAGLMELAVILPVLVEVLIVIPVLAIIPDALGLSE